MPQYPLTSDLFMQFLHQRRMLHVECEPNATLHTPRCLHQLDVEPGGAKTPRIPQRCSNSLLGYLGFVLWNPLPAYVFWIHRCVGTLQANWHTLKNTYNTIRPLWTRLRRLGTKRLHISDLRAFYGHLQTNSEPGQCWDRFVRKFENKAPGHELPDFKCCLFACDRTSYDPSCQIRHPIPAL